MELQHIFLFLAVASSVLVFVQSFRAHSAGPQIRAIIVLLGTAIVWGFARSIAGYVAALLWCALLVLPSTLRPGNTPYRNRQLALTLSPAVSALLVVNAAAFVLELLFGGTTNPLTLYQLGELDTRSVLNGHEYWRLFAALFLHYGVVHLAFNMFALVVLGPPLERAIGPVVFVSCYLLAGFCSSAIIVLFAKAGLLPPLQLVGASGCIMGIVGTWAGFLLRNRHVPWSTQRLRSIAMIIGLQIAFDLVTPDVSMTAHLSGLAAGFIIGLALPAPARGT